MIKHYNYTFFILIGIFLLLQIPLIDTLPGIMVDEPWYANTAWNFSVGNGFTNTVPGSQGGDDLFLFTFLLGIFFKLFGTSLFTARMVSIIGGLVGLIGFFQILKILKIKSKFVIFISGLLFIFSNVSYIIFRSVRPESWVVALGVWALYFLIKGHILNKEINYFFTGLLSSAAFLCHPHGAISIFLFGVIVLLYCYNKKIIRALSYYILGIAPIAIILFFYIFTVRQETLIEFFGSWTHRIATEQDNFIHSQMSNLSTFFRTYTLGLKRIFILLFELGVLLYGLFFLKKNKYVLMISTIGLSYFVIAMIFLHPFSTRHFGEVLIFSFVVFALLLDYYKANQKFYKYVIVIGLLYLANNLAGDLYVIWRDHDNISYSEIEKKVDNLVPDNTKVLSLLNFWFPLKNNENYNSYTRIWETPYKNIDNLLSSGDIKYVVLSDYMLYSGTGTSGRKADANVITQVGTFYSKAKSYAQTNGELIEIINTRGYGKIEIWKIIK